MAVSIVDGRRPAMDRTVHYALVACWEKSGCKIVADYPTNRALRAIALATVDGIKALEEDRISLARGKYTVHLLIGELHYACLTFKVECPILASRLEFSSYEFLQRIRSVYRELPIFADLSRDLTSLAVIDLSKPLKKVVDEHNTLETDILPKLEGELAEIRRALLDGVQKLIDRGQRLEEIVRKTQSLQIMSRKDFQLATRTSPKKNNALVATGAAVAMFLSTSLLVLLMYIGFF